MADNTNWPTDLDEHVQYLIDQAVDAAVTAKLSQANGIATLGADGTVPTAQLPAYFGVSEESLTGYLNDLAQYQASTPTLEELMIAGGMDSFNGSRGQNGKTSWSTSTTPPPIADAFVMTMFAAPIDMKINSFDLTWEYWNLSASDTNYWTMTIQANIGGTVTELAVRNTTATAGTNSNGSIVARTPWSFDAASWTDLTIPKGALIQLKSVPSKASTVSGSTRTQSCTPFGVPMTWTLRYSPV